MAPAFSKEVILQGSIDHLCLVCESYLRSDREACLHVATPAHIRNFESIDYLEKYRQDRIKKVKKWYFCEFCNVLVSTITAVGLHVQEPKHMENKSSQVITRVDDVIVVGNISINEEAWQGFVDESTCSICNEEYDDKDVHKKEPTHVISLIQSKVSYVNNNVYRMIDDSTFHCLTCNEIVAEITAHLDDTKHKAKMQDSINAFPYRQVKDETIKRSDNTPDSKKGNKSSSDILDSIPRFQNNDININLESRTAVCRICSVNLEFNCKEIENHIEKHKNNIQKETTTNTAPVLDEKLENNVTIDSGASFTSPVFRTRERENKEKIGTNPRKTAERNCINDIQKTAEEYGLTYIPIGNKVYCQICNRYIPAVVWKIIGHVNGELHKAKRPTASKDQEIENKKSVKKCSFRKVPFTRFLRNTVTIKNTLTEIVIINDEYCIDILGFYFFTMISPGRIRCQVCEVNMPIQDINDHIEVERHERAMKEVPVLIREDSELLREIRSDVYQCGYCNIYDTWEEMENHLKSTNHKENVTFAKLRLSQYMPLVLQRRMEHHLHREFLKLLLS